MKAKKYLSLAVVLVLFLTTLVGCGENGSDVDTSNGDNQVSQEDTNEGTEQGIDSVQYLNLILAAEPSTLDASKGSDMYSNAVLNNVLEPLTRLEEDENQGNFLAPAGAETWEHNEDGSVWTFHLRDNKWSDGETVKAQDYEYGIKRSVAQETASPYAFLLTPIKNASKVNSGELSVDELGVKALDEKTLEITLEGPTPYFEQLTYQRICLPQRQDIVEANGDKYGTEIDTLVYNGPFILTSWTHNSELVLAKNENYWDKDNIKLNNVNLKIIQDENAVYNSLSNGSVDSAVANRPEWKERFLKDENLLHIEVEEPTTFFKFFNTQDEVFKNVNVRKAFSAAIDREEIAELIYHGVNVPAYGWVAPNMSVGDEEYRSVVEAPIKKLVEENPDPKALLIKGLEELGMDTDPSKLTVTMTLGGTDQWFRTYGEYIQQMYKKSLGVNLEVKMLEWPVFSSAVEDGDFQIGYMAWGADYNDPSAMLNVLTSDSNAIATGWNNERYDELIDLATNELDHEKRIEYFEEAETILLYDEAVLATTVYPRSNIFRYNYVNKLGVTPFGTAGYKYGFTQGR